MRTVQSAPIIFILIFFFSSAYSQLWKQYADSAKVFNDQKKYDTAIQIYLKAKEELKKDSVWTHSYVGICDTLANLYRITAQYEKAETFYLESKQILEKISGKDYPDYATSCYNLGRLYRLTGQYKKADSLLSEAKQIREKTFTIESRDYALICYDLAFLYEKNMGQFAKAEPLYLKAMQIWEKVLGKESLEYTRSSTNLAHLYYITGQYEKAEALYIEARQIRGKLRGKGSLEYARSCTNLALFYYDIGQYEKAEPLYAEAIRIFEKDNAKEHPQYALSCTNLGILYTNIGQYDKAEPFYLEAKRIREKLFGKEHPVYAESCINLANLYWNLKKPEKAIDFYKEAFISRNFQRKKIFEFTTEVEKQSYLKSIQSYLKSIADLENYFLSFSTSAYSHFTQGFSYNVCLSIRNLILSSSQQLREAIYNAIDTSLKNKYNNWINLREQLISWYTKPVTQRPDYVKGLEEQANILEKELTRLSSAFKKEQAEKNITWQTIQQNLKSNEAAIEFAKFNFYNGKRWTDSTYYVALLLTKNAEPKLIFLFEEKQLSKFLYTRSTSKTIAALYTKNEKTNSPYNLIWQRVENHLQGIKKIYFAPAGLLYRISLPALLFNDKETLSDKYQLIQLNSTASVASQSENFIDTSDKICLYGGIKYDVDSATLKQAVVAYRGSDESVENIRFVPGDSTRGGTWQYLPGTEKEISKIENYGKQKNYSVILSNGISASEESIKALNGKSSPAVLHIASHGFFYPDPKEKKDSIKNRLGSGNPFKQSDNPLFRSGLLFAGANNAWKGKPIEGVEDGILTAYEVSNLYLPNTKLVVLSACETGLGDIQGNEGVYGLQRAFKIAGVENLIMSLWKVPDEITAEFMQEFYKNIFDRQSIYEAFYNAQTAMKNKYKNEPYKWAAWVLVK